MDKTFNQTLAYVNMNPLNIRFDKKTNWFGSRLKDRKGFVQFAAFSYGYRAAVMILRSYAKRGLKTVPQIIETWAPRSENDTEAYINSVLSFMSPRQSEPFTVDCDTVIDLKNRDLVVQLLLAMTRVEMGANHAQVAKMRPYAELGYDLAVTTKKFFA
ncbi:MAG: hypothetical protein II055_05930 [Prevotella sp.]|nr:hypothetical protein [Prevotella sp.]